MAKALSIAAKVAMIIVVTAGIMVLFSNIQIPVLDYTTFRQALNAGVAVVYHWCPVAVIIMPLILAMVSLRLAILAFEVGAIAWRWVFKVNE